MFYGQMREYFGKLVQLGISQREAKIYSALLAKRELTASEIHELAHISRTKIYEATKKLVLRGMCIEKKMGKFKKYQAVNPEKALNNLISENEDRLANMRKLAKELVRRMSPEYSRGEQIVDMSEYVEIIEGFPSIHERYLSLLRNTRRELLGFVKPPYSFQAKKDGLSEQEKLEFGILKKGGIVRGIFELAGRNFPFEQYLKKCTKAGGESRIMKEIPIKMYVFDEEYVLMALENPKHSTSPLVMLVVKHSGLARAAKLLFTYLWQNAKPYQVLKSSGHEKGRNKL